MNDKDTVVVRGQRWQHVKRGTSYEVVGIAELQAGQPQLERAALVIYRGDDGKLWARNSGEFADGRFTLAAAPSTSVREEDGCPFDERLARTPYLVLPRLALQVMPIDWRYRFDAMLEEMEALGIETPEYHVFRDDGAGARYTRATVVNERTGYVRIVGGEPDPWAEYRHAQHSKVAALCPKFAALKPSTDKGGVE